MLTPKVVRIVEFSARNNWLIVIVGAVLMVAAAAYDAARFSIDTNVEVLSSQSLPWHKRQLALSEAFPQKGISAVIRASTSENVAMATDALVHDLAKSPMLLRSVVRPDSGEFFQRNGLLFESVAEVGKSIGGLINAQALISGLTGDPSLRGVMQALSFATRGVQGGGIKLGDLVWPLSLAEETLGDVLSDRRAFFSWQELAQGSPPNAAQRRQ
jgi:uncharacterized protein